MHEQVILPPCSYTSINQIEPIRNTLGIINIKGITMADLLQQLENLLEKSLENKLFSWLPEESSLSDILNQMIAALQDKELLENSESSLSDFLIKVSPDDYNLWFGNQTDLIKISQILTAAMLSTGIEPPRPPAFHILADKDISKGNVSIQPLKKHIETSETQNLNKDGFLKSSVNSALVDEEIHGFFTSNSGPVYTLDKHVVNIGRREDNDIILADPRVSRHHAQIRRVRNSFVLFDLNSTGGTMVNDKTISQITLATGDVVSFAGVILIYGQEIIRTPSEETNDLNGSTHKPIIESDTTGGGEIL